MKKILLTCLMFLFIPFLTFPQVGIGTTNPTKTLDINGELRIRETPEIVSNKYLVVDTLGNVGYTVSTSAINFDYNKTYSVSTGTPNYTSSYVRDTNTTGVYITGINNPFVELNLGIAVPIPPNTRAVITVKYFVPIALMGEHSEANGYVGATFFRNGIRKPEADRKFSIGTRFKQNNQSVHSQVNVANVYGEYTEIIENSNNFTIIHIYEVKGYIEQAYSNTNSSYRFNNWESWYNMNHINFPHFNRNWGVGYISYYLLHMSL